MIRPFIVACVWVAAVLAGVLALLFHAWWALPAAVLAGLAALGTWDLIQTRHTILRLYPILGHVRFLMELIRPEIRQYFVESNTEASPFDRETRDLVYERAKATKGDEPFGTERDVGAIGYEFLRHSIRARFADNLDPRVRLGGPDCTQPYDIALLNVSAMSFGSLSGNAIEALSGGAARGGFAHDTGEGGISPYHLRGGADLIWEVASGYFGCRDAEGHFDAAALAEKARMPAVKAISIKLSQGAKPGLGRVSRAFSVGDFRSPCRPCHLSGRPRQPRDRPGCRARSTSTAISDAALSRAFRVASRHHVAAPETGGPAKFRC